MNDASVERLGELFPQVVYTVNTIMDACTGRTSRHAGVLLWFLYRSEKLDEFRERYLETRDLAERFQKGFVISGKEAGKLVALAKNELFRKGWIVTKNGPKRVYLTENGHAFSIRMVARTRHAIRRSVRSLSRAEKDFLADVATKIVGQIREDVSG